MSYLTVKNEGTAEFEEKKSIFTGYARRAVNEDEAKAYLCSIRSMHKEAKHNVYAYVIGKNMDIQRYSDDGEPQGTGGIPVLEVIKKTGITDTVIVVTRYFGGILLGTGGLARAYSKGASMAVKNAGIVEKVIGTEIHIKIEYCMLDKVNYLFKQRLQHIENTEYTDKVTLSIYAQKSEKDEITNEIIQITGGKCEIEYGDESYFFKMENGHSYLLKK